MPLQIRPIQNRLITRLAEGHGRAAIRQPRRFVHLHSVAADGDDLPGRVAARAGHGPGAVLDGEELLLLLSA